MTLTPNNKEVFTLATDYWKVGNLSFCCLELLAGLMIFKLMFGFYIGFNDCQPNLDCGVIEQDLHA